MEPDNKSTNNNQVCNESRCVDGDEDQKIKCGKCKRSVHFACTNLPIYQLRLFFTKNYRSYICANCVYVPPEFQERFNNQREMINDHYKKEIRACENIIMVQKENEKKLKEGIVKMKENQSMKDEIVQLMDRKFKEYDRQITQTIKAEIMASNKLNLNSIKNDSKKQKQGKTFADATKNDPSNNLIPQF